MSAPEFSRPVRIDTLAPKAKAMSIGAKEDERAALAKRFNLQAIDHLSAEIDLSRNGDHVTAAGTLSAKVTQSCVASGEPVEEQVDEEFRIDFLPQPADIAAEDEIELSSAELDIVFYEGTSIDIGEAMAETLSLSIEPYPRSPNAAEALKQAGVKNEEEAGAFGALAALRDKLKG
jgi:uncharacterized metal-binding protein YceD (DUF177 family)